MVEPLPDKLNGQMEHWEDWSWQLKAYVSLFKAKALRVLEDGKVASAPIADEALERLEANATDLVDTELVKFSRQLHYLLTQFQQDYSEWETLKARYERQSGSALPDSILVATLLCMTTGALQQHLRLNVRSLDTYDTARNAITAYYQSRHVTGFRSLSDTSLAPMDIGATSQTKGMKGGRGKGPHWKGKGRGKLSPFGPLKGQGKGRGAWSPRSKGKGRGKLPPFSTVTKGKSGGGKSAHTGKGKGMRMKCWNCGQNRH